MTGSTETNLAASNSNDAEQIRSASLQTQTTLAHPVAVAGNYVASVLRAGEEVAVFDVVVAPDCTAHQVNLDLSHASRFRTNPVHIRPGGHLVFFVTEGNGGYSVRVRRLGDDDLTSAYDSRNLQPRDLFVAMPPGPGRYELYDRGRRCSVQIQVSAPQGDDYVPPPPAQIRLTANGFDCDELQLGPSQGITVTVETPHSSLEVIGPA